MDLVKDILRDGIVIVATTMLRGILHGLSKLWIE
tara:strand:+ start:18 stop:119 length:102 start_codon:yes stop_codon:yes gene_type:complete